MGGGGVLVTWDRLYTKTILQKHNATETQTYISIPPVDPHIFILIVPVRATKPVAFLG